MLGRKILLLILIGSLKLHAQKNREFIIKSPDGNIQLRIEVGTKLQWSATHQSQVIIAPSPVSLTLQNEVLGQNCNIISYKSQLFNNKIATLNYKKDTINDKYAELTLNCKGDYGIVFRAYDEGVAYRFFTKRIDSIIVRSEEASFNFADDDSA